MEHKVGKQQIHGSLSDVELDITAYVTATGGTRNLFSLWRLQNSYIY